MAKKRFRRKYLINKPLQFIYSGITIYLLLIGIAIAGITTYYVTLSTILSQLEAENQLFNAYAVISSINILLGKRLGLMLLGVMAGAFVLGVYYLHRIAGPVYRIEKTLKEMAEGKDVQPVNLRKKDFFKPLAEELNRVILRKKQEEENIALLMDDLKKVPEAEKKIEKAGF